VELNSQIESIVTISVLLPLAAAIIVGLFGRKLPRVLQHGLPCAAVGVSLILSFIVFDWARQHELLRFTFYTWLNLESSPLTLGFLVDPLSALMMVVVTFVSFAVHVYTQGYMKDDPGYARFFAYISFFTFAMLMLVLADNFVQMFFGWEGVGLASYLLIGFWFTKASAVKAGMKAFLMNRVGDFGFVVGIGLLFAHLGTMDFLTLFQQAPKFADQTIVLWQGCELSLITTACVALFIGAMGKSAQFPLHAWLPDSMEGPTPISALIHAATMVTAGIYMVARMSPLFELSETALSFIVIIGSITALLMAILGLVQNDIKRVIAYSTLSQLGYMTVALGVSAYSAAIFHLMTHAFFKALLFLAAGSVILALHHNQDLRKMGGLWKRLPITYTTALIGAWALAGLPPFSGFFSKEPIIEAARVSTVLGHQFAGVALTIGVFLTALYTFRMIFLAFHGRPRWTSHETVPHESGWVVWLPLVVLAIPSIVVGALTAEWFLYGHYFKSALYTAPNHPAMPALIADWHGLSAYLIHAFSSLPLWLALAGVVCAWGITLGNPGIADTLKSALKPVYTLLVNNYYVDFVIERIIARGFAGFSSAMSRWVERGWVRGAIEALPLTLIQQSAGALRRLHTGYLYHYAFYMVLGLVLLLMIWGNA
jgi:NADH-quinone oxidoreductase subunit L